MRQVSLHAGYGRMRVQLKAQLLGDDWLVVITNANGHLGAVAVGEYDPLSGRASSSVLTMLGHRDDLIAKPQAQVLAGALRRRVAVVAGLHIEQPTPEELQGLVANAEALIRTFLQHLADQQSPPGQDKPGR